MIKACLSMLAGAYALHFTSFATDSGLFLPALFLACLALLAGGRSAAVLFAVGLSLFAWHAMQVIEARLEPRFEGDSMLATVRILDFPRRRKNAISFVATPIDDGRVPERIRLAWYQPQQSPEIGDVWRLELRLRRPRSTSNPGVFDYETWLFRERIGATGYVVNGKRNQLLQRETAGLLITVRKRFVDRLADVVADPEAAAVLAAISVGARHLVSAEQWSRYARSGTSHLMAISGLHVGLAASVTGFFVLSVCAVARVPGNHLPIALLGSLVVAALYSSVSGFAVPARRATLMLCLLVMILLREREPDPFAVLGAACLLVVGSDPLTTLAPGFKLSFTAVLLLLWFARRSAGAGRSPRKRVSGGVFQLAAVQVFLLFGLLPLTVVIFGRIAFAAPIVNFVAVPLFTAITVPFTLAGFVFDGPVARVGDAALSVAALSVQAIEWLIAKSISVPGADPTIAVLGGVGWLFLGLVLVWVVLPAGWPGRHVAWLAAFALTGHRIDGPPAGCMDVRMLDVGQGLSIVVRTRERTMLYDTAAAYPGGTSMMERVVLPYLSGQGLARIDRVIVSHSDNDHAGGIHDLVAGMTIGDVLVGESNREIDADVTRCRRGDGWVWDGVSFRVLHPPPGQSYSGNDASCVIAVEVGTTRLLLTGDIGNGVELALTRYLGQRSVDVVVVPHHGSDTSSSRAFVSALAPAAALISAGYRNRWGLPQPDIVRRWQDAGAEVYSTALDGAVGTRLCSGKDMVHLERNRELVRRVWHER